jgi:hypothetical protein
MTFQVTIDPDSSSSDNSFASAMGAEMTTEEWTPPAANLLGSLVALRAAGTLSDEQFFKISGALASSGSASDDVEDHRIRLRLASVTKFRGDKNDFHMGHINLVPPPRPTDGPCKNRSCRPGIRCHWPASTESGDLRHYRMPHHCQAVRRRS